MHNLLASPKHFADIQNESAVATIRKGKRDFNPGDLIAFQKNDASDEPTVEAVITRVLYLKGEELCSEEFDAAGIPDGWEELQPVYPDATTDDVFTVLFFEKL